MIAIGLLLVWAALLLAGTTDAGRSMRAVLIRRPAAWFNRFSRGQAIFAAGALLFAALLFWLMGQEGLRLYSMYVPELMGLLASVEFIAAIDAIAVAIATAASVRLRGAAAWVRMRLPERAAGRRRAPRSRRPAPPANDAEGPALRPARAA
ncbi:hypothetical protein [Sphingomonas sp.]|uniref:hypothetical protein n=1 Tax=Sphingomonas sp. TaxID=28214 RepID=UPI002EDA6886